MIENIKEKEEEVKAIWLEHRDKMATNSLYKKFLTPYFDTTSWKVTNKDWLFFISWVRDWKKVEKKEKRDQEVKEQMKNLTDEGIEELQRMNRKKMIVALSNLLKEYEDTDSPMKKAFGIGEIRRMYKAIQSLEEKMKMTEISRGKLKLDAVRTLLPYKRLKPEELLALKEKINESFDRIIKLKSGESAGRSGPDSG